MRAESGQELKDDTPTFEKRKGLAWTRREVAGSVEPSGVSKPFSPSAPECRVGELVQSPDSPGGLPTFRRHRPAKMSCLALFPLSHRSIPLFNSVSPEIHLTSLSAIPKDLNTTLVITVTCLTGGPRIRSAVHLTAILRHELPSLFGVSSATRRLHKLSLWLQSHANDVSFSPFVVSTQHPLVCFCPAETAFKLLSHSSSQAAEVTWGWQVGP